MVFFGKNNKSFDCDDKKKDKSHWISLRSVAQRIHVPWRAGGSARRWRVLRNGATHSGKKWEKTGGGRNVPGHGTILPAARLFPFPRPAVRTIPFGLVAVTKGDGTDGCHRADERRRR